MNESELTLSFANLHRELKAQLPVADQARLDAVAAVRPREVRGAFEKFGRHITRALGTAAPPAEAVLFSRALIAGLAQDTMTRARARRVTSEVEQRTRTWLVRLLNFIRHEVGQDYIYPNELFVKDYRFVTALTLPFGAQVVDLQSHIGPKTALRLMRRHPIGGPADLLSPWFRVHTEGRYLDEFNDAGWRECYRRIAEMLLLHPQIRGMVATSWFYDPQLGEVSPRLGYLREYPTLHGAELVAHGTSAFDIQSATATSPTRRDLFETGKYTPVCHSLLWHRSDLMQWLAGYAQAPPVIATA